MRSKIFWKSNDVLAIVPIGFEEGREEVQALFEELLRALDGARAKVRKLLDIRQCNTFVPEMKEMVQRLMNHPNSGKTAILAGSLALRLLITAYLKAKSIESVQVFSVEEKALAWLA